MYVQSYSQEHVAPTNGEARIKVIGVGGGGGNALNRMIEADLQVRRCVRQAFRHIPCALAHTHLASRWLDQRDGADAAFPAFFPIACAGLVCASGPGVVERL
jgi:hypothetical protein